MIPHKIKFSPKIGGYKTWKCQYSISFVTNMKWAAAWDFQQFDILTSEDSDQPLQPPFKLRNSKWCSVSSLTITEYSSDKQRLWSDCAYAQADLRLCWSHIRHCWKSHALAHLWFSYVITFAVVLIGSVSLWRFRWVPTTYVFKQK